MELFKKSERIIKTSVLIKSMKANGAEFENLGEFMKWKELADGSRLSVSMTLYQVKANSNKCYFFSDSLGRMASPMVVDRKEAVDWLKNHGYKTTHDFYIEDYGMSEETWKEWSE